MFSNLCVSSALQAATYTTEYADTTTATQASFTCKVSLRPNAIVFVRRNLSKVIWLVLSAIFKRKHDMFLPYIWYRHSSEYKVLEDARYNVALWF